MDGEIVAALLGALAGAVVTSAAGFLLSWWSDKSAKKRALAEARLDLVREMMRFRGNQSRLIEPLNELPLMFGHDDEVLRLLRLMRSTSGQDKDDALKDLLNRLTALVGISPNVGASDLGAAFRVQG